MLCISSALYHHYAMVLFHFTYCVSLYFSFALYHHCATILFSLHALCFYFVFVWPIITIKPRYCFQFMHCVLLCFSLAQYRHCAAMLFALMTAMYTTVFAWRANLDISNPLFKGVVSILCLCHDIAIVSLCCCTQL